MRGRSWLLLLIAVVITLILLTVSGSFVLVPTTITLPASGDVAPAQTLTLSYISTSDIASLQAKRPQLKYPSPLPEKTPNVDLPEGFNTVPWHLLDLHAAVHKARKLGASMSGWNLARTLVDRSNLTEGVHVPRYLFDQDIKQLRKDNGCDDPAHPCPQYVYNSLTGTYTLVRTKTKDMVSK